MNPPDATALGLIAGIFGVIVGYVLMILLLGLVHFVLDWRRRRDWRAFARQQDARRARTHADYERNLRIRGPGVKGSG